MEDFKMFITKLKHISNLTEKELAEKIGISRSQLYRIKTGKSSPTMEFFIKIKNAFPGVNIDEFIEELKDIKQKNVKEKLKKEA
jgi:transcriptional regulator with XRE-family HTH domain